VITSNFIFFHKSIDVSVSVDNRAIIVILNALINAVMRYAKRIVEIFVTHVMVIANINVSINNVNVNVSSYVIRNHVKKGVIRN